MLILIDLRLCLDKEFTAFAAVALDEIWFIGFLPRDDSRSSYKEIRSLKLISQKSCSEVIHKMQFDPEEDQVLFPPNIGSIYRYKE